MKFSFIHTGDIHLGRPFSDLSETNEKISICNNACKLALNNIVNLAISRQVNFVLISGDSFDSDEHNLSAKLCFIKSLETLADNGIKSYVICGNHDPIEMYKRFQSYFKLDEKYKKFINITGVTTEDNSFDFEDDGYVIHALSFETDEMSANQLSKLNSCNKKLFNIGLLHCDLDKTESKYSPVSREELRALGYDYYALGHIHVPEIKEDKIVYSGTPQARTKKETGEHGCFYVEVENKNITNIEFVPTDVVRFKDLELDCSEYENKLEIFEEITNVINNKNSEAELTLYEITLTGVSKSAWELSKDDNLLKDYRENFGANENKKSFVYQINNNSFPLINEEELLNDSGVIGIITGSVNGKNNIKPEDIYDDISKLHEKMYKNLCIDDESTEILLEALENDKDEIISRAKSELKSLCSEIYGN